MYYVDCEETPEVIIIATGSEVELAVEAAKSEALEDRQVRVVSMPSTTTFRSAISRNTVNRVLLPADVKARDCSRGFSQCWLVQIYWNGWIW